MDDLDEKLKDVFVQIRAHKARLDRKENLLLEAIREEDPEFSPSSAHDGTTHRRRSTKRGEISQPIIAVLKKEQPTTEEIILKTASQRDIQLDSTEMEEHAKAVKLALASMKARGLVMVEYSPDGTKTWTLTPPRAA